MSHTVPIDQAAANLAQLVDALAPGDEIVLTRQDQPVAKILPNKPARVQRRPGMWKGKLTIIKEDDDHLKDFAEYMP
jgi:antitoxin (DNA-binding transcriptional repressor) of toxin-antitoxin stability system